MTSKHDIFFSINYDTLSSVAMSLFQKKKNW